MVVACGKQKVQELPSVKYHGKKTFTSKKNYEDFAVVIHIPQTTQYLVISQCCFAWKFNDPKTHVQGNCSTH